jgi:hypothetical protein
MRIHPSPFMVTLLLAVCAAATLVAYAPSDVWGEHEPRAGAHGEHPNADSATP